MQATLRICHGKIRWSRDVDQILHLDLDLIPTLALPPLSGASHDITIRSEVTFKGKVLRQQGYFANMPWWYRLSLLSLIVLSIAVLLRTSAILEIAESVSSENGSNATNGESPTVRSAEDLEFYGRLAVDMTWYHTHIKKTWDKLYRGTEPGATEPTDRNLVGLGLSFCNQLQTHHDIEEMYWFPKLGEKMEEFRPGHFASEQHKEIHTGLDVLRSHLNECWSGLRTLDRRVVRSILDSFGGVLWQHMTEEVQELGAENMAKYWTREEMSHLLNTLA